LAFSRCIRLRSIYIPPNVDTIDGTAFERSAIRAIRISEGNEHFRVSGNFLESFDGRFLYQYFGRSSHVQIPSGIEVICMNAFSIYHDCAIVDFGADSRLRRIDVRAFSLCERLHSICIPSHVDTIDGSAFQYSGIQAIRISEGNAYLRVSGDLLESFDGRFLYQ
jgi:hypothetical protein